MEKKTIDPMSTVYKVIDMSMKLVGAEFPVNIFPSRILCIIREVHECHSILQTILPPLFLQPSP